MKPVGFISAGVLLLLLGAVAPTYAQLQQHEEELRPRNRSSRRSLKSSSHSALRSRQSRKPSPSSSHSALRSRQSRKPSPSNSHSTLSSRQSRKPSPSNSHSTLSSRQSRKPSPSSSHSALSNNRSNMLSGVRPKCRGNAQRQHCGSVPGATAEFLTSVSIRILGASTSSA